ncbi:hypothetical protein BD289DRAFT_281229 [Coniella lustricola]|uniref:Uncharacterized protein n=1 Tax=Coniella lustricola TaxID=2025994 RepID=A0A2T3A5Y7_9PEZI|nr:hypothetical protein BD289DRAFT_281229 [Coniella lustricola]
MVPLFYWEGWGSPRAESRALELQSQEQELPSHTAAVKHHTQPSPPTDCGCRCCCCCRRCCCWCYHCCCCSFFQSVSQLASQPVDDCSSLLHLSHRPSLAVCPSDDKSSYSLPEDGTPVTIKTRGHKSNKSQTSLLIEYFEGGKPASPGGSGDRKPSVRVRLTPSKNRKTDHIQITETKMTGSGRKASLTRRADRASPLTPSQVRSDEALSVLSAADAEDARSLISYQSATEESNVSRNPIEVDIDHSGRQRRRRPASPLIPSTTDSKTSYQPGNMSEISAIPTDSFLDGSGPSRYEEKRSKSPSRAREVLGGAAAGLAAAAVADKMRSKSRSESTDYERSVLPKSRDRERSERRHKSRNRKSSGSEHQSESGKSSSRRRSSKEHKQENIVSGADSSVLSSAISHSHRSIDASSMQSGASKTSINNPKLLETVEDAIRRLILPELNAIKREQSKREARRGSVSSAATGSKEETETDSTRQGYSSKSRETLSRRVSRDREARHELLESPAPSVDHDSVDESLHEIEEVPRNHDKLKAAAAGAALGALAENLHRNKSPAIAREQRRRRRAEAKSRLSERYGEDGEDLEPAPPMPLMSELNPSDITRTSILSAETDSHSASEELTPILQVSKGTLSIDSRSTGSRTGSSTPTRDVHTQPGGLGMQHANISHGDLRTLPQRRTGGLEGEYEQEYMRKAPIHDVYEEDEEYEDDQGYGNNYYNTQEVPPPLKYVPYEPERRGLSPIPSVSGYTEGGSELYRDRESRISHRTSDSYSPEKSLRRGGASPSLLSQESWRDDRSVTSSRGGNRNTTYTDDSELDHFTTGTAMRAVGARGDLIASPAVQSHVASLVEGSTLTDSIVTSDPHRNSQQHNKRASAAAMEAAVLLDDDAGQMAASSREQTPEPPRVVDEDTVSEMSEDQDPRRSEHYEEYDLDKYGRKVPISKYRQSPTASEAAITGAAVGAAAAALRAAAKGKGKQQPVEEFVGEGVSRNKSFKDRTREGHLPANTPTHSIDRLDEYEKPAVGHSGLPDASDPLPEIGYFAHDSDALTNPSRMSDRLSATEEANRHQWDDEEPITPTQESMHRKHSLTLDEAAGAAAVATAAALAHTHSQQFSDGMDDDWYRTDEDRKRDTIVTNPYEGTSPLVNVPGIDMAGLSTQYDLQNYNNYGARSPFGPKIDEGYISQGPNRTPDNKDYQSMDYSGQPPMPARAEALFNPQDPQYMNGMPPTLGSPMYDAATGAGIEQIESKDIITLMQHLMVRDAQRSARDTEILVTLVRTAAEMRNSFDDIKKMLADTEDVIITEVKDNTEKTVQRHLGGPRPYPGSASRSIQNGSQGGTDNEKKTRNLWQRALKGLSNKGTNDLTRIEDMLMQLLGEVDVLKSQNAQSGKPQSSVPSLENIQPAIQYEQDRGYEPEGHAGTSTASYASQSGQLSIPRNPSAGYQRKVSSGHRISTVPEGDEEDHFEESNVVIHSRSDADMTSPVHMASPVQEIVRADSEPLGSPFQMPVINQPRMSYETTGRPDRGKKHKSNGSSSWFPKISRWSETTASSVGKAFRKSKEVDANSFRAPSRSTSSIGDYDDYPVEPISPDQLHSGLSDPNLHPQSRRLDPNQIETDMTFTLAGVSRTPLSMDQVHSPHPADEDPLPENPFLKHCESPEDPKYRAHRNSLNLQHPQPRNGQTEHFRTLETTAQNFDQPMSPESANWGSVSSLSRFTAGQGQPRYGASSSLSQEQGQYTWEGSAASPVAGSSSNNNGGPQRPPKEPLESPSISSPPRGVTPTRNRISALGYKPAGSPKPENRNLQNVRAGAPARRPSGPRAMGTRSPVPPSEAGSMVEDRRRKRGTRHNISLQRGFSFD